jgi:hypothetical protein
MITAIIGPLYFIGCMTELSPIVIMTEITYKIRIIGMTVQAFFFALELDCIPSKDNVHIMMRSDPSTIMKYLQQNTKRYCNQLYNDSFHK